MQFVKEIHIFCAYTTGLGFLLRGVLVIMQSSLSRHRLTRILPHVIDTCLLVSGLLMAYLWSISPFIHMWLSAKILVLLVYIGFGLLMIRWGRSSRRRWLGLTGGLVAYSYIVGVAHSKSVLSYFSLI
ncbi:MAG: SirB2 family protein [Gammaproteobacteria bacterium]|nr:SirB2 family protein [Gammaproteobacteria bacterium]